MNEKIITITYTNYKGKTAERPVIPIKVWFGKTKWHTKEQWFLKALDIEKNAERDFAMKDIGNLT